MEEQAHQLAKHHQSPPLKQPQLIPPLPWLFGLSCSPPVGSIVGPPPAAGPSRLQSAPVEAPVNGTGDTGAETSPIGTKVRKPEDFAIEQLPAIAILACCRADPSPSLRFDEHSPIPNASQTKVHQSRAAATTPSASIALTMPTFGRLGKHSNRSQHIITESSAPGGAAGAGAGAGNAGPPGPGTAAGGAGSATLVLIPQHRLQLQRVFL
ncbi:hypothetical protein G7046_g4832 [Stylonectria norvegica]|nr:hypothetical protein G7046_g4832 [Stylonectria norvegica]